MPNICSTPPYYSGGSYDSRFRCRASFTFWRHTGNPPTSRGQVSGQAPTWPDSSFLGNPEDNIWDNNSRVL